MRLRMVFTINTALVAMAFSAGSALAQVPVQAPPPAAAPAPRASPVAPAQPPPPRGLPAAAPAPGASPVAPAQTAPPVVLPPPATPPLVAPPAAAPEPQGPVIELPSERDMPQMTLPRETAIENPLRQQSAASATAIGGYGELTLNAPSIGQSVIDLRRLVLFVGHNFNERIRFYSELEVEHAVASSDDQGEFEVEQAYLDGLFSRHFNLRAGLIIMPVGIINVYHEPPTFNGVDRPDVDTLVIPSTWREAGFGAFGEITQGLSYQVYLTSGFDANGFTAEGGIQDGHQEAQLATASTFGAVARLTYEPVLATIFGLSAYGGTSGSTRPTSPGGTSLRRQRAARPFRSGRPHPLPRLHRPRRGGVPVHRRHRRAQHGVHRQMYLT